MSDSASQQREEQIFGYEGEPATFVSKGAGAKKAGKTKRAKGESDLDLARKVVEEFSGPLAYVGGNFWVYSVERGWEICDDRLINAAHERLTRNAETAIVPIIRARVALPSMETTSEAPIYWERIGGRWEGEWVPLKLSQSEILYTDHIYDVVADDVIADLSGRIVWGPMISVPWSTESGDPPDTGEIERLVEARIPDREIRRHFQEVCGCILQPHVVLRGQIVLWGDPGCGKTTVAMAIAHAPAGSLGVAQQQERELVKNKWSRNQLVNRFVNISDDSERVTGWTGFVKRYTSGCFVAEPKYGKPATCAATAKLISTCNEMQDTTDASGAMVDRLLPFRLDQRVTGEWDSDLMTPQYWSRPGVRAAVVEWMAKGLNRLRVRGRFDPPQSWLEAKDEAVAAGDTLEGWLIENLIRGNETDTIKASQIMEKLPADLGNRIPQRVLEMKISKYLKRLFGAARGRIYRDGERFYVYTGLAWR